MATIDVDMVFEALGVRADGGAAPPAGGMSGSAILGARTRRGDPVVVKVTELAKAAEADRGRRELHVYTDIAQRSPIPSPRLIAAHETDQWIAIAVERHAPTQPASAWTTDQWVDLANLLARMHSCARGVEEVPPHSEWTTFRTHGDLLAFARQLWNGPGDGTRIETVAESLDELRAATDEAPQSFVHGDSHLGNVVRTAEGRLLLVDWQSARIGSSAGDIAFALTRAAAVVTTVPRDQVIAAYSAAADVDPNPTHRAVTAHQLLTLVEQYPEFADFLGPRDVDALRHTFDVLLNEWTDHG